MDYKKYLRIFYRILVLSIYIFSLGYDLIVIGLDLDRNLEKMKIFLLGRVLYATHLSFFFQIVFHFLALLNEFIGNTDDLTTEPSKIQQAKDYTFAVFAFPLSTFISSTFWIIYAINREWIFPESLEEFVPSWINHVFHTLTAVLIILELVLCFRKYPTKKSALKGLSIVGAWYMFWIYFGKIYANIWPYKFMDLLNLPTVISFNTTMLGYISLFYFAGEFINNKIWARMKLETINE